MVNEGCFKGNKKKKSNSYGFEYYSFIWNASTAHRKSNTETSLSYTETWRKVFHPLQSPFPFVGKKIVCSSIVNP
jgi:hypothetical protein